jgi:probable addiction module antidote protein
MGDVVRSIRCAKDFDTRESIAAYLNDAMREGDPAVILSAIGKVARARGMAILAKDAGLSRNSLYKSLCANGNPSLSTLTKVVSALGLKLTVAVDNDAAQAALSRGSGKPSASSDSKSG